MIKLKKRTFYIAVLSSFLILLHFFIDGEKRLVRAQSSLPESLDAIKLPPFIVEDSSPTTENRSCTIQVNPGVNVWVDGSGLAPGDTVCLNAGEYRGLTFHDLNGADGNRILIRNNGGRAVVRTESGASGGQGYFAFYHSSNVRLSGTGDAGLRFGIYSVTGLNVWNKSTKLELDHLEFEGARINLSGSAKDPNSSFYDPNFVEENYYVHHNYFHDLNNAAVYLGSANYSRHPNQFMNKNSDVSYNIIVHSTWKGIQFKSSLEGGKVHHNFIYDTCSRETPLSSNPSSVCAAINITVGSSVDVYNNLILKNGSVGIMGQDGGHEHNIYNNLIADIYTANPDKEHNHGEAFLTWQGNNNFFNNTIAGASRYGIFWGDNAKGSISNNIVVGSSLASIRFNASLAENIHHNLLKEDGYDKNNVGFVNPSGDVADYDYHLTEGSPAIDAAVAPPLAVNSDLDGVYRPQGAADDIGAYEFIVQASTNPADFNNDGRVDGLDLLLAVSCFGRQPIADCEKEDVSQDSVINSIDFGWVVKNQSVAD